ncbi:Aminodeoxychorismate synthase component 1 [Candidatus Nitrotoga sp. HW29]|uniref:aminodeoxychorismate synthase component I n=1 Tax=Candidatus Nitrotoga sp. HW29 TaxID=2886963 RepID=UPI001EF2EDB0|nr:aminodeoxychorismate synthase component I [Candidatus Nitrotoga sp. HW29]CAH1905596.1 Aminodeoxychorismate synthase component 1 [Candidatus Nitrotoga sp. HW29]
MLYSASLSYAANAAAYFVAIADLPWAVWLDSGGRGRYDILCAQPIATLVTQGACTEITNSTGVQRLASDPFDLLRQQLGAPVAAIPDIPFLGGALGYWGYDLARHLFTLPTQAQETEHLPDMMVGIYDWAIVLDHQEKTARLVSQQREHATEQVLPQILARLKQNSNAPQGKFKVHGRIQSNFTRAGYQSAFDVIQRYLHAGDCYQVNLAQRYAARASGDSLQAYLELRRLSPAPYSAFFDFPQVQILCASPERFLQVQQGRVETNPIKGTRPRHNNPHEDAKRAQELGHSDKDRAENLMIVDLLRNDLGKSCIPGSVQVPKLFELESFAQVHHLVSTVTGQLAPGRDALALLRDCFPGGSVTGAPKQRAIQIIEQLEPHRRGIYCGAIGYIGFDGNMDSNIAIRTLVFADGEIRFWAGGGIVADSDADAEYQETLHKAAAMLKVLQQYGGDYEQEA